MKKWKTTIETYLLLEDDYGNKYVSRSFACFPDDREDFEDISPCPLINLIRSKSKLIIRPIAETVGIQK